MKSCHKSAADISGSHNHIVACPPEMLRMLEKLTDEVIRLSQMNTTRQSIRGSGNVICAGTVIQKKYVKERDI
jgi:hypothetical protein